MRASAQNVLVAHAAALHVRQAAGKSDFGSWTCPRLIPDNSSAQNGKYKPLCVQISTATDVGCPGTIQGHAIVKSGPKA